MPSVNAEPRSNSVDPENSNEQPSNEITNENINVNESPVHSAVSASYLNISFQEIINLLAHNESPALLGTIRRAIRNSSFIVFTLTVFVLVALSWKQLHFILPSKHNKNKWKG